MDTYDVCLELLVRWRKNKFWNQIKVGQSIGPKQEVESIGS